jgi:hypothetical protein
MSKNVMVKLKKKCFGVGVLVCVTRSVDKRTASQLLVL